MKFINWQALFYGLVLMASMLALPAMAADGNGEIVTVSVSGSGAVATVVIDPDSQLGVAGDCSPTINSTGFPAMLMDVGGDVFTVSNAPVGMWSMMFVDFNTVGEYPFGEGHLCLHYISMDPDSPTQLTGQATLYASQMGGIPGATLYRQVIYRDPTIGPGTFNITSMVATSYLP